MNDLDGALVARASLIAERVALTAERSEREGRLDPEAVAALRECGAFKMLVPREHGGAEVSLVAFASALEAIARADGASGWCAMVGATTGLTAAWLTPDAANEVFGAPDAVACGVFAPTGRARRDGEHYRVSGRWSFASGCDHATWRMVGAIDEGGRVMSALLRADQADIVRNWDVVGLRGTGSHDLVASEALAPVTHTLSLFEAARHPGALYRLPPFGVLAVGVAAVNLGVARFALDRFVAMAREKVPSGARRALAQRETVQLGVAQSEARLRAARAMLHEAAHEATAQVVAGGSLSLDERASLRLAACHAARASVEAVDALFAMAGAGAVRAVEPLQRAWRDVHVASQHAMVADAVAVLAGRARLGLETDGAQL